MLALIGQFVLGDIFTITHDDIAIDMIIVAPVKTYAGKMIRTNVESRTSKTNRQIDDGFGY